MSVSQKLTMLKIRSKSVTFLSLRNLEAAPEEAMQLRRLIKGSNAQWLDTVLKLCYILIALNREKQSVGYNIRVYLFSFLKHIQFSCFMLVIKLVHIAIMLQKRY